jgi:DNA-binding transcriptional ArsR family regulator
VKTVANLNNPSLVRALAHPMRVRLLGILQERRSSPVELARELGEPLTHVSYHVRILNKLGLIRLVGETPVRGAVQHHYEAVGMARVSDETWGETPEIVKEAMIASALAEIGRSVSRAAALGGFERSDAHLTRTHLTVDERGWRELAGDLLRLLERAERVQRQSAERLKRSDHEGELQVSLVMMLCETQQPAEAVPSASHQPAEDRQVASSRRGRQRPAQPTG